MDFRPIGIFDSGVGGLTVARAIIDQFPEESITYIGDTRFVSNQRGYSRIYDQAEQRDYNREHYVLI